MADNTYSFANFLSSLNNESNSLQTLWRRIRELVQAKLVQERNYHVDVTLGTANDPHAYVTFERAGTITSIRSVITGALATGNEILTFKNNAGTSMGTITLTQAGSAAGDKDALAPTANNTFAAGESLEIETNGGNANAELACLDIVYELT